MTARGGGGFRALVRDSGLYALGRLVGKAIGLLLLPVYTRTLTTAEFGRVDLLTTIQSAGASILLLGMDLAATRLYAALQPSRRGRVFSTLLALVGCLGAATALGAALSSQALSRGLFGSSAYGQAVFLTGLAIMANGLQLVGLTALRNQGRPAAFAAVSVANLVTNGVLVILLLPAHPSATTVLFAVAVSMGIGAVGGLVFVGREFASRIDAAVGRRLLVLGGPLVPALIATWGAEVINRAVLIAETSATEAAYFSLATRFSSVALLAVIGFQMAWQPAAFAHAEAGGNLSKVGQEGQRLLTLVAAGAVLLGCAAPELIQLVSGTQYLPALSTVGWLLVFAICFAAYQVATMPSAVSMNMRDLGISASVGAVVGVALNLLTSRWGAAGTGLAVAAGQGVAAVGAATLGARRNSVPFQWQRLALVISIAAALVLSITLPHGGAPVLVRVALAGLVLAVVSREFFR